MKHISISGPVAAGKTTLLRALMTRLGSDAEAHEEKPQDNPFIQEYYSDSKRWSFHSQITFLALYFDDPRWRTAETKYFLYDRALAENLVLARYRLENGDLTNDEYAIIEKTANGIASLMPEIDAYIYLNCSVELLEKRLAQRGRAYENGLGREYAEHQKRLYDAWAAALPKEKTLILNADAGFDMEDVIRFIEQ